MTDKEHTTNNFAKDINAPSKEQVIIDGVDVSECAIYRSSHTRTLCCSGIYCKEQQFYNCYFKQLARKTQECEELKIKLMQKDEVNTFFNTPIEGWSSNPCDICESKNNYEQLKHECEELKEKIRIKDDENSNLNKKYRQEQAEKISHRKALKEVKEIVKDWYKNEWSCYMCRKNMDKKLKDILDIINKAKGSNNDR